MFNQTHMDVDWERPNVLDEIIFVKSGDFDYSIIWWYFVYAFEG